MKLYNFCFVILNLIVITTCEMRKSWKKSVEISPTSVNLSPFDSDVIKSHQNVVRPKFRSTFIGNKTLTSTTLQIPTTTENKILEATSEIPRENIKNMEPDFAVMEEFFEEVSNEVLPKSKKIQNQPDVQHFNIGPLMNLTIEEPKNIVKIKLNETIMRSIFEGRAKRTKMMQYAMPLFILPFLIQSALIPFMLSAVKLFLLKSFFAGKLAVLLLLLGAFKNYNRSAKTNDVYAPERRYEPIYERSEPYQGYQAVGRPTNWVN